MGSRPVGAPRRAHLEDMPRLSYVPIVEEPLVLIKSRMLQEFELLDCAFNGLAAALRDFALRANRCGYRVVRANHARVTIEEARKGVTAASDERDEEILRARFPYLAARNRALRELAGRKGAEASRAGFVPMPTAGCNIVFACNNLGKIHNGTSELAKRVITEFSLNHSSEYNIHVLCSRDAFDFHDYGELNGVAHLSALVSTRQRGPFSRRSGSFNPSAMRT